MTQLTTTIFVAMVIVVIAIFLLGIGWILTGKSRVRLGMCGRVPTKRKGSSCGTDQVCPLCEQKDEKDLSEKSS